MKTTILFGIQFAQKYKWKAQVIAHFKQWKREKQYFLTEQRNKEKLFERILNDYLDNNPDDHRTVEKIASDLWDDLQAEVAIKNWENIFHEVLGKENVELPNYQANLHISRKETKELFRDYNCKHYYLTESAVQECAKMHVTDYDMSWLRDSLDGKRQLNWGDNFIRYEKKNNRIVAVAATLTRRQNSKKFLQHTFFILDLDVPIRPFDRKADIIKEQCEKDLEDFRQEYENRMRNLLYNMITFLDLIPLKLIRLPGWGCLEADSESLRQVRTVELVYNNTNVQIIVVTVTINWNCSIWIEETWVKGHKKSVLYGKNKTKVRTRFIKPYERKAHERPAGKLKHEANATIPMFAKRERGQTDAFVGTHGAVGRKQVPSTIKSEQKAVVVEMKSVKRGELKQQQQVHPFYIKLAELKKKLKD